MKIVKYYEPELDEAGFMHDIGTEDYWLYFDNKKKKINPTAYSCRTLA